MGKESGGLHVPVYPWVVLAVLEQEVFLRVVEIRLEMFGLWVRLEAGNASSTKLLLSESTETINNVVRLLLTWTPKFLAPVSVVVLLS